jgi:ABC-type transport system involved in multi-copper enzyme maturation permease subunit
LSAVAQPTAVPAASLARVRPSFPGAVRSELLKLGRQWLTWALLAAIVAVTAIAMLVFLFSGSPRTTLALSPDAFYFQYLTAMQAVFTTMSGVFLLIASSRLVSMEYGSGAIRVVLARGTGRLGLLAAQYTALAIAAALVLAAFLLVAAVFLYATVVAWQGSFAPIASLPQVAWADTWRVLLAAAISSAVCILLGTAAAVVGRSVAFGVGVATAFFPADNFGTIVMALLGRLTHLDVWGQLTQYFLGPALNRLPGSLQTDHQVGRAFAMPLGGTVDATHCLVVIGVYALAFLAVSVVLTWRRDVLH